VEQRARINFFVDTFISKVGGHLGAAQYSTSQEAKEEAATKAIEQIVKELEPLLKNANPFFNGSPTLTLAEVCILGTLLDHDPLSIFLLIHLSYDIGPNRQLRHTSGQLCASGYLACACAKGARREGACILEMGECGIERRKC
jgi:hypothetical protein